MNTVTAYVRQGLSPKTSRHLTEDETEQIKAQVAAWQAVSLPLQNGGELLIGPGLVGNTLFQFDPVNLELPGGEEAPAPAPAPEDHPE